MDLGRSVSATYGSSRDIGGDAVTNFYDELGSAMPRTEPSLFPMGRHVMDTTSPKKPYSSLHACGSFDRCVSNYIGVGDLSAT